MSRNPKRVSGLTTAIITLLILAMIAATVFVIWLCIDMVNTEPDQATTQETSVALPTAATSATTAPTETTVPPTTEPEPVPEHVVSTATISSQGDLLMHKPVFDTCRQSDGSYDFSSIFRYVADYTASYDYALANLETTFGGDDFVYQGNPEFNCPDGLADAALDAGYDMLLTANNHAADTLAVGITRTLEQVRSTGLATLGTQLNDEEPKYSVVDVNGIKIGMVCYTYAYSNNGNTFSLNGLAPIKDEGQVNFFMNNNLDKLYEAAEQHMADMKAEGAEATMFFIHWGVEYQTTENATQNKIAQKLCDLGYDVIVGGHPHVVQPVELLESTVDPDHKTVCIYSLGNAVSNQRTGYSTLFPAGYTEDGALFTVTFEKYSDGNVYVSAADVIPTWVNMHTTDGVKEYNILPLEDSRREEWRELFNLNDNTMGFAEKSYDRTMGIVGEGLGACQTYLEQAKTDREAYYYDLAYNPEKYAAEAPAETTVEETTIATEAAA